MRAGGDRSAENLTAQLKRSLGETGFVALCQQLGGTRVYISRQMQDRSVVVRAVGHVAAERLRVEFAPATIRVPLGHSERAAFYRKQGLSHAHIALRLGMTENGVAKLLKRVADDEIAP